MKRIHPLRLFEEIRIKNSVLNKRNREIEREIDKRIKLRVKDFNRYDKQAQKGVNDSSSCYGEFMSFRMLSVIDNLKELKQKLVERK